MTKSDYPNRYKPHNRRKAQRLICEFMNSGLPIVRVDWEKNGYLSHDSCRNALENSIKKYSEPVCLIVRGKQIYLIDYMLVKDI